jgi:hypothetical protein
MRGGHRRRVSPFDVAFSRADPIQLSDVACRRSRLGCPSDCSSRPCRRVRLRSSRACPNSQCPRAVRLRTSQSRRIGRSPLRSRRWRMSHTCQSPRIYRARARDRMRQLRRRLRQPDARTPLRRPAEYQPAAREGRRAAADTRWAAGVTAAGVRRRCRGPTRASDSTCSRQHRACRRPGSSNRNRHVHPRSSRIVRSQCRRVERRHTCLGRRMRS